MISLSKLTKAEQAKLKEVSNKLGIAWPWLWLVIQHESGWNTKAVNPYSMATGLIQFMPFTAKALGVSPTEILKMSVIPQLDLVYRYLKPYAKKMKDLDDVYLAVFYPAAIGKPANHRIGEERSLQYAELVAKQNPANNPTKDRYITISDIKQVMNDIANRYNYTSFERFIDKLKNFI